MLLAMLSMLVDVLPGGRALGAESADAAGVVLDEVGNEARAHLQRVDELLASGRNSEAVDAIGRAMDDGARLIRVAGSAADQGFVRYLPVRRYGQLRLSALHNTAPDALRIYRRQVDALAGRAFEEALAERDEAQLRDVVDAYFASSFGDDALFWLGEFAFQRGDMAVAREHWERISPAFRLATLRPDDVSSAGGYPLWPLLRQVDLTERWVDVEPLVHGTRIGNWLVYPDADVDLDQVRARLVLASLLEGDRARAAGELELFRRISPRAEGTLGGRRGRLVDLLADVLRQSDEWPQLRSALPGWPTFTGAASRNHRAPRGVDVGGPPRWSVPLPRQTWLDEQGRAERMRVAEDARGLLSFHPVVAGNRVLFSTSDRRLALQAVGLDDGELLYRVGEGPDEESLPQGDPPGAAPSSVNYRSEGIRHVPRFTSTVVDGRLYLTLASPRDGGDQRLDRRDRLVGLDVEAEGKLVVDVRLQRPAWDGDWRFEGPPVCDGAWLYVSLQRVDAVRTESHVACFGLQRGELRWRRFVSASPTIGSGLSVAAANNLLALHQGRLYYNTNAGVVAGLRADSGEVDWVVRYPRSVSGEESDPAHNRQHAFRDLNPCLVDGDRVYVAPTDCNRLFSLDAPTGKLLWASATEEAADAVHLLGVGGGNLIASGDVLYWFDRFTGRMVARFPAAYHAAEGFARPSPRGLGRGLLAGAEVYWPTRTAILVFSQQVGGVDAAGRPRLVRRIDLASRGVAGGNLVIADETLIVAAADRLYALDAWGAQRDVADRRPASGRETE